MAVGRARHTGHERAGTVSPSRRLYEPEAESRFWAGEKKQAE
ncbi:MAG: hypothetical protein ACNYWU_08840 [Desulfobacterales bacterium]